MKFHAVFLMLIATMGFACLVASVAPRQTAAETGSPAEEGKALFQEKCSGCHTIGGGRLVGPDLKGVTATRSHDWLEHFISAPDQMIASGDPDANRLLKEFGGVKMPNLGLAEPQVDALLAYLAEATPAPGPVAPSALAPVAAGNATRGEELFTGVQPLQKGGAACIACHSIAGTALLGGGTLGPDLTGIYKRLGGTGLASVLATLPFPTMKPIFQTRPLTAAEQADLLALFLSVTGREPSHRDIPAVAVFALVGCILLLVIAGVVWRKRLRNVSGPLLHAPGGTRKILSAEPVGSTSAGNDPVPRRHALKALIFFYAGLCALVLAIPFLASLIGPALRVRKTRWVKVGKIPPLTVGSPVNMSYRGRTEDAYVREPVTRDVWVVELAPSELTVYSPICPHLGCHYNWDGASGRFACPCHGSVFAVDGKVLGGPAPRPLDTLSARVEHGELFIQWEQFEPGIPVRKPV